MTKIRLVSLQAPSADSLPEAVASYLSDNTDLNVMVVNDVPWQERKAMFDRGEVHIAWMCGTQYTWQADAPNSSVELLAAHTMQGGRYEGKPAYFSDVIVGKYRPYHSIDDLADTRWAYNEPESLSGYWAMRYALAVRGQTAEDFFGKIVEAGSHVKAVAIVSRSLADSAAIDSTVLEALLRRHPDLVDSIRIIESLGPNPIPPWVIRTEVPEEARQQIRFELQKMHESGAGKTLLSDNHIDRFVAVTDDYYNPVRKMVAHVKDAT